MRDWDDYRLALALQRTGTLRGAAERLGVNHATVSRRLAALNERLGTPAFERVDSGYGPTRHGESLVAAAEQMEDAVLAAEREALGRERAMRGPLVLSLTEGMARYLLLDEIGAFAAAFPEIELILDTSYGFANLDRREADLVIRVSEQPPGHLVGRRLFKYARCAYAAPDYLAGRSEAELRWLGRPHDKERPVWAQDTPYPEVPVGLRFESGRLRHAAARAGLGMVFEACFFGDSDPRLVRLPGAEPIPHWDIWVLTHPDLKDARKVTTLLRHMVTALTAKRDLIEGRAILGRSDRRRWLQSP